MGAIEEGSMSKPLICLMVLSATLVGANTVAIQDPGPEDDSKATPESPRKVLDLAGRYEFLAGDGPRSKCELRPEPLLTYTNPIRGDVYGDVFVWTRDGRPAVIGAIFDFRSEDKLDTELHALAPGGLVGLRDGEEFWNPAAPGVELAPVPDAPAPSPTAAGRARQMNELARRFAVERDHPEQGKGAMRLLTRPLYRYSSPAAGVADGALFVFAEGTDPEAYLLLEATSDGEPAWRFAFARMNIVAFDGSYRGKAVWHADPVSWDAVFDGQGPYAIVRERPLRGLRRSR
jgi:hypothetical protein